MEHTEHTVKSVRASCEKMAGDGARTRDVQLGKTTVNWKHRLLRFQHLVLAIENPRFLTLCLRAALNGAQTEHTHGKWKECLNTRNIGTTACDLTRLFMRIPNVITHEKAETDTIGDSGPKAAAMIIRREQISLLSRASRDEFVGRVTTHLERFFPEQCSRLGATGLHSTIRSGIERASTYGITAERHVCLYLDVMMVLGNDFDGNTQFPWAISLLTDPHIEDATERIEYLYERALELEGDDSDFQ